MANPGAEATILLIEDELDVAQPLVFGLQGEGFKTLHADRGAAGLALARREHPDVILLDVRLPDTDGFTLLKTIRAESTTPVIMVTARGQELDRVMGLELGADDYIVKPFSFRELVARVRALLRRRQFNHGDAPAPADRMSMGDLVLDRAARQLWKQNRLVELSPREFELLLALMEHPGQALSRQELLDRAWGQDWVGDPRTLDVHIRWLREKIEPDAAVPLYIQTVRGHGYRFAELR
ncbi:MAG: response regulator transcription factor [Anaerolineae bacterium]